MGLQHLKHIPCGIWQVIIDKTHGKGAQKLLQPAWNQNVGLWLYSCSSSANGLRNRFEEHQLMDGNWRHRCAGQQVCFASRPCNLSHVITETGFSVNETWSWRVGAKTLHKKPLQKSSCTFSLANMNSSFEWKHTRTYFLVKLEIKCSCFAS